MNTKFQCETLLSDFIVSIISNSILVLPLLWRSRVIPLPLPPLPLLTLRGAAATPEPAPPPVIVTIPLWCCSFSIPSFPVLVLLKEGSWPAWQGEHEKLLYEMTSLSYLLLCQSILVLFSLSPTVADCCVVSPPSFAVNLVSSLQQLLQGLMCLALQSSLS